MYAFSCSDYSYKENEEKISLNIKYDMNRSSEIAMRSSGVTLDLTCCNSHSSSYCLPGNMVGNGFVKFQQNSSKFSRPVYCTLLSTIRILLVSIQPL